MSMKFRYSKNDGFTKELGGCSGGRWKGEKSTRSRCFALSSPFA